MEEGVTWMSIKVLIADDDTSIREALADLIGGEPGLELAGAAADAAEAVTLARKLAPDVALVDVRMPLGGGPKAAAGIRLASPQTVVIALSAHDDAFSVLSMLERGVATYVAKDSPAEQVIEAIRRGAEQQGLPVPPPA